MPYFTTECEIDLDTEEFYRECSKGEKVELAELLAEDGYVVICEKSNNKMTHSDFIWNEMMEKILLNRHRLSIEEEMMIKKIYDKL